MNVGDTVRNVSLGYGTLVCFASSPDVAVVEFAGHGSTKVHVSKLTVVEPPPSTDWDARWLATAAFFAEWSKDSTKVGCVVVGPDREIRSTGYNGPPRGVFDLPARMVRPEKYLWFSHAEENAVAQAARVGVSLKGCTAYVTHECCSRCARSLIQAGVTRVVCGPGTTHMPPEEFQVAATMFQEAGVKR